MFHLILKSKVSQKHNNFIAQSVSLATSFDLQSHYQAILNIISICTLSGSAHMCTAT